MSTISTHVLDLTLGRPAAGVAVILLAREADGRWGEIAQGVTDADGRLHDLTPPGTPLAAGVYCLQFDTGAYFLARGVPSFHPEVAVTFHLDGDSSCHVPLLISPFGYSTYRGS